MKDWDTYSASKAKVSDISGSRPKVSEYFLIKLIDNGLLATIVVLTVLFAAAGAVLQIYQVQAATWFFDLAKLAFGVILGMIAQKKRGR